MEQYTIVFKVWTLPLWRLGMPSGRRREAEAVQGWAGTVYQLPADGPGRAATASPDHRSHARAASPRVPIGWRARSASQLTAWCTRPWQHGAPGRSAQRAVIATLRELRIGYSIKISQRRCPNQRMWDLWRLFIQLKLIDGPLQVGEISWQWFGTGVFTPRSSSYQALNRFAIFRGVGYSHFKPN